MDLWQLNMPKDGKPKGPPEQLTVGIGMREAVFSPDGSRLAYSKGRRVANLWRIRIPKPGDELATWASAEQITFDNALIEFVDLSPDGRNLLFSSDRTGNQDIWKMAVVGGELEQLTTNPTPDWNPMLSPDGEQIVFYSYRSGNRDIWVMPMGGGAARQLTNFEGPDIFPSWSPDSKMIAFVSNRGGNSDIWVLSMDGGKPTQLTKSSAANIVPKWSPDGEKIAFLSGRGPGNTLDLWMMLATGRESAAMMRIGPDLDVLDFGWSPDGHQIYFKVFGRGLWELSVAEGSIRQLIDLKGRYGAFELSGLATDGQYLYFPWEEDTGDLWVMDVEKEE